MIASDILRLDIPPQTRMTRHIHDAANICLVLKGTMRDAVRNDARQLAAREFRLSPPAMRDLSFGADGAVCVVAPIEGLLDAPLEMAKYGRVPSWAEDVLLGLARQPSSQFEQTLLISDIVSWSHAATRHRQLPPRWLIRVRDSVRDEGDACTAAALALQSGVHRVHLSRSFRAHFGISLSAYLQKSKLRRAMLLLTQGDHTLAQVAVAAGYFDQAHLARWTGRLFGVTPAALRMRLQSSNRAAAHPLG